MAWKAIKYYKILHMMSVHCSWVLISRVKAVKSEHNQSLVRRMFILLWNFAHGGASTNTFYHLKVSCPCLMSYNVKFQTWQAYLTCSIHLNAQYIWNLYLIYNTIMWLVSVTFSVAVHKSVQIKWAFCIFKIKKNMF